MLLAMQSPHQKIETGALPEGAKLCTWLLRRWVDHRIRGRDPRPVILAGLGAYGLERCCDSFERLMQTVCGHARRLIDIRMHGSIELSTDEFLLCRAIQSAAFSPALTRALMLELLDRQGAFDAARQCEGLAADLASAGLDTSIDPDRIASRTATADPVTAEITRLRTGS